MITARAVTDHNGIMRSGALYASTVPMYATKDVNYTPDKSFMDVDHLDKLLNNSYSLLSNYIIEKLGISSYTMVHYGGKGNVKWIKLDGKTYWARGRVIHDKNK